MFKFLGTFVAVLAAIVVAIFMFAPERLPPGIGLQPVPLDVTVSDSVVGQILGQVLGEERMHVTVANHSGRTLRNVIVTLRAPEGTDKKRIHLSRWEAGESRELGALQGWNIEPGDRLRVKASAHYPVSWTL